jgi:predicted transposase YbfD/YdcC
MEAEVNGGFLRYFQELPDPRGSNCLHRLTDMLVIALCAVICGANGWTEVALFGRCKQTWFETFLALPHGIPSHDTFGRVFARLNPEAFERCFLAWMSSLEAFRGGRLVAIDGKSIRRSFEHAWDKSGMAHLVSAFASANRLVLGQVATADKENEITAIPKLLELVDVREAVVTIDALGCQKGIAGKIVAGGGDYVLAVKENQPTLYRKVKALMQEALLERFAGMSHGVFEATDGDHGRVETRRVWVTDEVQHLRGLEDWPALNSLVMVESRRQVIRQEPSVERRFYISSLRGTDARRTAEYVRGHWGIENGLHWQLDVSFREDERRIRKGHGAENFSRLCRLALNLLKRDKTKKAGIAGKRLAAGWDHDYLLNLLAT